MWQVSAASSSSIKGDATSMMRDISTNCYHFVSTGIELAKLLITNTSR
jgi:hypothetical protein